MLRLPRQYIFFVKGAAFDMKIGHGYDVHRFGGDKPLVLGGVTVENHVGLIAHSDGDVLLHALCDAILGAAGLKDIGHIFPDNDEKYKGISSILLLNEVAEMIKSKGLSLDCADITIVADKPKMAKYIPLMIEKISETLGVSGRINIKSTTEEGLGLAGLGIGCHAVCLLNEESK